MVQRLGTVPFVGADFPHGVRNIFPFFFCIVLPLIELNGYISMHPDNKVKHRLRRTSKTSIESVYNGRART